MYDYWNNEILTINDPELRSFKDIEYRMECFSVKHI